MKKIIFAVVCLITANVLVFSQSAVQSFPDSKSYSESEPYSPREILSKISKKPIKSKKKKENKNGADVDIDNNIKGEIDRSITVPVTILDKNGNLVSGLSKSNFQIFADEKEVSDFSLENKESGLNVILMFDTSATTPTERDQLKKYAIKIIENLEPQDKVMLAGFSERLKIKIPFTDDKKLVVKGINKMDFNGGTSLYDSVEQVFEEDINKLTGRTAVILVTNGVDTTSVKTNYIESLETAEKYELPFFVVYVDSFAKRKANLVQIMQMPSQFQSILGNVTPLSIEDLKNAYETGANYLTDLATLSGGGAVVFKESDDNKTPDLPKFAQELRSKYYLKFMPSEIAEPGKRIKIKIRVNRPNMTFSTKGSFLTK